MLGLPHGIVKLVPYTPKWKEYYEIEAAKLRAAVGEYVVEIRHMGSTAIPGIRAKPIIDILMGLADLNDIVYCREPLLALNYQPYEGGVDLPDWYMFTKVQYGRKTHHLHVVEWNSDFWITRILFQKYLCRHPEVAAAYEELKVQLAIKYADDRDSYTQGKSDFIQAVMEMAIRAERQAKENGDSSLPMRIPSWPPSVST